MMHTYMHNHLKKKNLWKKSPYYVLNVAFSEYMYLLFHMFIFVWTLSLVAKIIFKAQQYIIFADCWYFQAGVWDIESSVVGISSLECVILSHLLYISRLECEILSHLLLAHCHLQEWEFLPTLFHLNDAHTKLADVAAGLKEVHVHVLREHMPRCI